MFLFFLLFLSHTTENKFRRTSLSPASPPSLSLTLTTSFSNIFLSPAYSFSSSSSYLFLCFFLFLSFFLYIPLSLTLSPFSLSFVGTCVRVQTEEFSSSATSFSPYFSSLLNLSTPSLFLSFLSPSLSLFYLLVISPQLHHERGDYFLSLLFFLQSLSFNLLPISFCRSSLSCYLFFSLHSPTLHAEVSLVHLKNLVAIYFSPP